MRTNLYRRTPMFICPAKMGVCLPRPPSAERRAHLVSGMDPRATAKRACYGEHDAKLDRSGIEGSWEPNEDGHAILQLRRLSTEGYSAHPGKWIGPGLSLSGFLSVTRALDWTHRSICGFPLSACFTGFDADKAGT